MPERMCVTEKYMLCHCLFLERAGAPDSNGLVTEYGRKEETIYS